MNITGKIAIATTVLIAVVVIWAFTDTHEDTHRTVSAASEQPELDGKEKSEHATDTPQAFNKSDTLAATKEDKSSPSKESQQATIEGVTDTGRPFKITGEIAKHPELLEPITDTEQYIEDVINNRFRLDEMSPSLKTWTLTRATGRSSPEPLERLVEVLQKHPDMDFAELQRDIVFNHKNDNLSEQDVMAKIKALKDNQVFEDSALSVTQMAKAAAFNNYSDVLHSMTETDSWADIPAASKAEFVNMAIAAYSSKYRQNTVTPEDRIKLSSMLDNLYQLGVQSDSTSLRLMDSVGLSGTDVYLKAFEQQLEVED